MSISNIFVLFGFFLALPILTKTLSTFRFRRSTGYRYTGTSVCPNPPILPYWDIFLGQFFHLAWDTRKFVKDAINLAWQGPVEVKAGFIDFTVVSNPDQIKRVFRACKQFSNKQLTVVALQNIFGASREVARLFENDEALDLGEANSSHDTNEADEGQLNEHVNGFNHYARKYLSGSHLHFLSRLFLSNLEQNFEAMEIQSEWVHYPDLYTFLRNIVSPAATETLMGKKIFEIHPQIVDDFWSFDQAVPSLIRLFPRWLIRSQYRARDRIFDAFIKLDEFANHHVSRPSTDDPEWEPYMGSAFLRARHDYAKFIKILPANTKAWEKMGILFAANSNLLPAMFWYIMEALKDKTLHQRMDAEVFSCLSPSDLDVKRNLDKLLEQPLLQSAYAETLRLRVAIALPRTCESGEFDLSGRRIEKDKHIVIFTWPTLKDDNTWIQRGNLGVKALDEFWPERFLVPKEKGTGVMADEAQGSQYEFSLRGLGGRWMPYGGGQHLCPGRHLAKRQLIGTFAYLTSHFDLELLNEGGGNEVGPDMRWFPTGTLPPDRKVPFKIKRKLIKVS
ncbi:cytochrome P450 [Xylaria bambusicola]|uniref:cytochrome P450 n=1 Tax=Xylaria bambusicola TaxID=326684 RepID=UPI0020072D3B|nr:cytochrome P450 [Xylaria bambusicola]KAI0521606.1 cytochrome P450 [Xylaria bambusicola]